MIWIEVYVASVTYFPPTERRVNSPDRKGGEGAPTGRGGRGWIKGGKLGSSSCCKWNRKSEGCVDSSLAELHVSSRQKSPIVKDA
jgi:hypothetical protein